MDAIPELVPSTPLHHALTMAEEHRQAGRLDDAVAAYEQILAVDPDHREALHRAGRLRYQQCDHEAGIAMVRRALALDPRNAAAHENLWLMLREQGRLAE